MAGLGSDAPLDAELGMIGQETARERVSLAERGVAGRKEIGF